MVGGWVCELFLTSFYIGLESNGKQWKAMESNGKQNYGKKWKAIKWQSVKCG